jgi:Tol biopolymer transport system component
MGLALMLALACSDVHAPEAFPAPEFDVIVSNPVESAAGNSRTAGSISLSGSVVVDFVYASLPPGSVSNGQRIVFRTRETGAEAAAVLVEGGFDPIAIPASVGDTLDVRLYLVDQTGPEESVSVVPERRPPVLVRVDPTPGRRDVPLNAVLLLVFSEPIDAATLTPASVSLSRGGSPVAGALAFGDPANLTVRFTPAEPLAAGADYTLLVTQELTDRDGDALTAPATVGFTTQSAFQLQGRIAFVSTRDGNHETDPETDCPSDSDWCITPEAEPAAECDLQSDTHCIPPASIYAINADGSGLQRLTTSLGDAAPAWSADGSQIAFAGYQEGIRSVYVMSATGSNVTRRTDGLLTRWHPELTWSPNGSAIGFAATWGASFAIFDHANGAVTRRSNLGVQPSWSPDGRQIAFVASGPENDQVNVHTSNVDGSLNPVPLTHSQGEYSKKIHPAWSPDGSMIAYVHGTLVDLDSQHPLGNTYYRFQIALVSANGAFIKYLAPAGDFAPYLTQYEQLDPGSLAWSPDGRAIAYSHCDSDLPAGRPCSETQSIRYVTLDGAEHGTIVTDAHSPSWRP